MSDSAILYIVIAVIVVVAILWARSGVRLRFPGVEASVDAPPEKHTVTVAENVKFEGVEVGKVTGQGVAPGGTVANEVRVMNDAEVKGGKIGDISGVVVSGSPSAEKK